MKNWTKEEALTYIDSIIDEIENVKKSGRNSSVHTRWLSNTLVFLVEVFGEQSLHYLNIKHLSWSATGTFIIENPRNYEYERSQKDNFACLKQIEIAKGILLSAKDQLEHSSINEVYTNKNQTTNNFIKLLKLSETKLRKIIRDTPNDETEVQDKYEDLLIGADIKYSKEFPRIEYSSKQYVPDFSFAELDLAVELKICKDNEKKLISQLNDDILAYKTKFQNVLFIIYDLGIIRDVEQLKQSFEKHDNVFVQIVKH